MPERNIENASDEFGGLSYLAQKLLFEMARNPDRLVYNTNVLGGMFRDSDVKRLDDAYAELEKKKYIEPANGTVSYFGQPKTLYRITETGKSVIPSEWETA